MASQRVLSLLPAATEMVFALGAGNRLVGRSHECDFPLAARSLPMVTESNIDPNLSSTQIHQAVGSNLSQNRPLFRILEDLILDLKPDLILTQETCAVCAVGTHEIESLLKRFPSSPPQILALSPTRFSHLWTDLRRIGQALGLTDEGRSAITLWKNRVVEVIQRIAHETNKPTVVCLEWLDPLMGAGNWIPELVELAGGIPKLGSAGKHSEWISIEDLTATNPDVLISLPCGFDLPRTVRETGVLLSTPSFQSLHAVRHGKVFAVDGKAYFNRPGPRLIDSLEILADILHPHPKIQRPHPLQGWQPMIPKVI